MPYTFRPAVESDVQAIADIYNASVLDRLLTEARARHMRKACGIIFADNVGSIALMRRFGFTQFGLMPAAATDSTGTMRDMSYWYLDL